MADEDRLLPIANVGRIMKQSLPGNAKISKEAKQTLQECATEFISFVTGEASAKCHKENRKTVNGDDICWALSTLGLDNYAEAVIRYLHKYRQAEIERSNQTKAKNHQDKDQVQFNSVLPHHDDQETETPVRFREFLDKDNSCNSQPKKPS